MVDGHPTSPVLIIGTAPDREGLQHDKPFLGGSGRKLWQQLQRKAGINRADCYIINTIGEWPLGSDGNPTKEQLDKYWDAFDEAVARSRARVAILLGGAALERFTGLRGGIENWRGYLVSREETLPLTRKKVVLTEYKTNRKCPACLGEACPKCKGTGFHHKKGDPKETKVTEVRAAEWPTTLQVAIPTIHPAAVLRSGMALLPALASDLGRAGRALNGTLVEVEHQWEEGVPTQIQPDPGGPVVVDIETDMGTTRVLERIGANNGKQVMTAKWDADAREYLRTLLNRPDHGPTLAFNIGFDAPRLAESGVPLPEPWWDVMLAAAMCQPNLKKSLNYVASLYLDKHRHKHLSAEAPAFYNAQDVGDTLELYYILRGELERSGQLNLFESRMMPAMPVLVEMSEVGMKVDAEARRAWMHELLEAHDIAMARWQAVAPGQKTAGTKLKDFLFYTLKLPLQYHKYGKVTTEVAAIQRLLLYEKVTEQQRETLEALKALRLIEKDLKTYAQVEMSLDGCVHPGYLPAGKDSDAFGKGIAGTGRIISAGPNMQNQNKRARRMFIPHDPSMILVARDWSQLEARIVAKLSGDKVLQEAINAGLHKANSAALGVDSTRAKNGFYGWMYGVGKRTLSNTFIAKGYPISESECAAILAGLGRRYRDASAWRDAVAAEMQARHYLANAFGRRRYFLGSSGEDFGSEFGSDIPAALDFHPQSDAADMFWSVLRPVRDRLREIDARLLVPMHDELVAECPRGKVKEAQLILKEEMERPFPELDGLSVPTEGEIGENWGEMSEYHDA
jgi:uracil-DNA glycosylase family 4